MRKSEKKRDKCTKKRVKESLAGLEITYRPDFRKSLQKKPVKTQRKCLFINIFAYY